MDLWLYQEMIHEFRPDVVIEAGTKYGGSAYYFARLFDLIGHGQVITIDTKPQPNRPEHPRITYLTGSSTDPAIAESVDELVGDGKPLIVLDSSTRASTSSKSSGFGARACRWAGTSSSRTATPAAIR